MITWRLVFLNAVAAAFFLCGMGEALAQQEPIHYSIPRVAAAPQVDGDFSPGEWIDAERVSLVNETHPRQNVPALVDTEVYLMEDGDNFYLAFVAHDPEPEHIRAFYRDRDNSWSDDFVGVVIDTFNDERRAFEFFANPLGVQMDLIMDDVVGREDSSWNAIWDSAGRITGDGFVVEMRIPLNQLRYAAGVERQVWGIDLLRFYPRDVRHRLSNNTWDYGISCYICQLKKAEGFAGLEPSVNLQLIPTLTASLAENRPNPLEDPWERGDPDTELGLDVRWGINQDMILNATFNPDFSQVETDNAQLDINNTFSLFFPERREFFLDGADYFNTQVNLVHTRNISSPNYGIKLTGKQDVHTYGLFVADDETTNFLIPGNQGSQVAALQDEASDNLVMRYRRDLGARNSTLGVITTARRAQDYANTLLGVDGNFRFSDADRLTVQLLGSRSEYPQAVQEDFDQRPEVEDQAYLFNYSHQGERWQWNLRYDDYGEDFRADMGFINRVNYRQPIIGLGHTWRPEGAINRITISGDWDKTWDQDGLELEEESEVGINMNGPMQSFLFLGYLVRQRYYNGQYFDEWNTSFGGEFQPRAGVSLGLNLSGGDSIDFANTRLGEILTVNPRFTLQLGRHLQLRLQHNYQTLDVAGGRLYETNLSDLRLTWQFNVQSFLRAIVQYSDTRRDPLLYDNDVNRNSRSLTTQLLYSYRVNAQTRFFIGYSDTGFDDDNLDQIEHTNRTVFAKFSYAWQY